MKTVTRKIILSAGLFIFLCIAFLILRGYLHQTIRTRLTGIISRWTGHPASVESVRLSWNGTLTCKHILSQNETGQIVLSVSSIQTKIGLPALINKNLIIEKFLIDTFRLNPASMKYRAEEPVPEKQKDRTADSVLQLPFQAIGLDRFVLACGIIKQAGRTDTGSVELEQLKLQLDKREESAGFSMTMQTAAMQWNAWQVPIDQFAAGGYFGQNYIRLDSLTGHLDNQALCAKGRLDSSRINIRLKLAGDISKSLRIAELPKQFRPDSADYLMRVHLTDSLKNPGIRLFLNMPSCRTEQDTFSLSCNARWQNSEIQLDSLIWQGFNGNVRARGHFILNNPQPSWCSVTGNHIRLGKIMRLWLKTREIDGIIGFQSDFNGILSRPESWTLHSATKVTNFNIQNQRVRNLKAKLTLVQRRLSATIQHPMIHGRTAWVYQDTAVTGDYHFQLSDRLSQSARASLRQLHGSWQFSGRAQFGKKHQTAGLKITADKPGYKNRQFDTALLHAQLRDSVIRINRAELQKGDSLIFGRGQYLWKKDSLSVSLFTGRIKRNPVFITAARQIGDVWQINLTCDRFMLSGLHPFLPETRDYRGQCSIKAKTAWHRQRPSGHIRIHMEEPQIAAIRGDSLQVRCRMDTAGLTCPRFALILDSSRLTGSGSLSWQKDSLHQVYIDSAAGCQGQLTLQNMDIAFLQTYLPENWQISGLGSGRITWQGTLHKPSPNGHLELSDGSLKAAEHIQPLEYIHARLSLRDSLLQLDTLFCVLDNNYIEANGALILSKKTFHHSNINLYLNRHPVLILTGIKDTKSKVIELQLRDLNLALARQVWPDLNPLNGSLNGSVTLRQWRPVPDWEGAITGSQIEYTISDELPPLDKGRFQLRFTKHQAVLDSFILHAGKGDLLLMGSAQFQEYRPVDLSLSAELNNLMYKKQDVWDLTLKHGKLNLNSRNKKSSLEGVFELGQSRYEKDLSAADLLSMLTKADKPKKDLPAWLQNVDLDVKIQESDKIRIMNNLAKLRLRAAVTLNGSISSIRITGRMATIEGNIYYLDREFRVESGTLDFSGGYSLNPQINLRAIAQLKDYETQSGTAYTVYLNMEGPVKNALPRLTSEPPLPEADLIALLTLGATRAALTNSDPEIKTDLVSVITERAGQISSRKISGYASRQIGTMMGLTSMSIRGNLFRFDKSWGPQLVASKKLSKNVSVTYHTTVGNANDQEIRLDYKLDNHLSLQGLTNQKGETGIDLKYKIEFP